MFKESLKIAGETTKTIVLEYRPKEICVKDYEYLKQIKNFADAVVIKEEC